MKVYIAYLSESYGCPLLLGVYSTLKDAKRVAEIALTNNVFGDRAQVDEREIDTNEISLYTIERSTGKWMAL